MTADKPITVNTTGAQTPTSLSPFRAQGRSVLSYVVQTGQTRRYFCSASTRPLLAWEIPCS